MLDVFNDKYTPLLIDRSLSIPRNDSYTSSGVSKHITMNYLRGANECAEEMIAEQKNEEFANFSSAFFKS